MALFWKIEKDQFGPSGVSTYLVQPGEGGPYPLVLCYHGLGGDKSQFLPFAMDLAARGFVVALPDAVHHGDRLHPEFDLLAQESFLGLLLECVLETSAELPGLIDALQSRPDVAPGPVGMTGFSMGGYITFRTCCQEARVQVAAPCAASGDWTVQGAPLEMLPDLGTLRRMKDENPLQFVDRFPPRALLIQNGSLDDMVPVQQSRRFYELARPAYAGCPERLEFVEYRQLGHEFPPEMQARVIGWMERWLGNQAQQ